MDHTEPTLPPLPDMKDSDTRPSRPSLLIRKRTYDQSLYDGEPLTATSSDPALFSGDEPDSIGAEDYATKRKKRMYTGSWWSHQMKAGKGDRKKEIKRNYDSGIFMGSDSEPPSSDSITSLEEELIRDQARMSASNGAREPLRMLGQHLHEHGPFTPPAAKDEEQHEVHEDPDLTPRKRRLIKRAQDTEVPNKALPTESMQSNTVMHIVRRCLDQGQETVDLSGRSLSDLPPEIAELAYLTKETNLITGMLESGTSLETHLRLFLGNNFLRRLPLPILDLTNLRELSLRRNKLTRLPAGIRNLVNLEKLNISGNKLTYLPFEVIDLVAHHRLHELTTEPNLWESNPWETLNSSLDNYTVLNLRKRGSSGTYSVHGLRRAFQTEEPWLKSDTQRVPSLTEMSLRQLLRLRPLEDLRQHMPASTSPKVLGDLQRLNDVLDEGGRWCNSCQRPIIDAARTWIEWWRIHHVYVPVRRMQCGGACIGKATEWCDESSSESRNTWYRVPTAASG